MVSAHAGAKVALLPPMGRPWKIFMRAWQYKLN